MTRFLKGFQFSTPYPKGSQFGTPLQGGVSIGHPLYEQGVSIWHPFRSRGAKLAPLVRPNDTQVTRIDTHSVPSFFPESSRQVEHEAASKKGLWETTTCLGNRIRENFCFLKTLCLNILYIREPSQNWCIQTLVGTFPRRTLIWMIFDRSMIDLFQHQAALSKSEWCFLLARSPSSIGMRARHTCNPCWLGSRWCIHSLDFMGYWDLDIPKLSFPKLPNSQIAAWWLESPPQLCVEKGWERVQYQPSSSVRYVFRPGIQQLKHMRSRATTFKTFWIGMLAILKPEARLRFFVQSPSCKTGGSYCPLTWRKHLPSTANDLLCRQFAFFDSGRSS